MRSVPTADGSMQSPKHPNCVVCDQPLGGEPFWIVEYPRAVHERCRPWLSSTFPFGDELEDLRATAAALAHAYREVVGLGRELRALQEKWPPTSRAPAGELKQGRVCVDHALSNLVTSVQKLKAAAEVGVPKRRT